MANINRYHSVLQSVFNLEQSDIKESLTALDVDTWDSMGQMNLATALENEFKIFLDPEDIIQLISYINGIQVLKKHGIVFW